MITKKELQKYISIVKEVPDQCGPMETGDYNTKYIGQWGVYAFCYLPKELAEQLKDELILAYKNDKPYCKKVSYDYFEGHRLVCTLNKGHEGLCIGGCDLDDEATISGIFEPDEDTDTDKYVANVVARKIVEKFMESICDD